MSLKVLVADDNLIMRNLLKYYLSQNDISDIFEAKDGLEALQIIKSQEIDLLFLDLRMPNLDGFNVAHYLTNSDNKAIIVALSADMTKENKNTFIDLGARYFLQKPIDAKLCNKIIQEILKENEA